VCHEKAKIKLGFHTRRLFGRLVEGAETQRSKIYVRVFVIFLLVCSQWGLERTKPTPAGTKTAHMASS